MSKLKTFNNLLFIVSAFLLININCGCSFKKNKVAESDLKYPAWFLSASADDHLKNIYSAVGESVSETDAIAQALNSIASRISIEVASTYKSQTTLINNIGNRELSLNIEQNVKKIEFNNYKIIKSEIFNNKNIVLVVVNRSELANNLTNKLNLKIDEVEKEINFNSSNRLDKLKKIIKAKQDLNYLKSQISIIKTVNNNFDVNNFYLKISDLEKEINLYINNISFYINMNDNIAYNEYIKKMLNQSGYAIFDRQTKNNSIFIKLSTEKTQSIVWGNLILKVVVLIEFIDNEQVIFSEKIIAGGKSSSNIKQAEEFAQRDFETKLNKNLNLKNIFGE